MLFTPALTLMESGICSDAVPEFEPFVDVMLPTVA
jgi:hypothetical protein